MTDNRISRRRRRAMNTFDRGFAMGFEAAISRAVEVSRRAQLNPDEVAGTINKLDFNDSDLQSAFDKSGLGE